MIENFPITKNQLQTTKLWKPLFAVLVWGLSFIATKSALMEVKPEVIVFLRQLLGILFLAAVHLWIQVTGLQWTTASHTGWIIGITPVFMAILGIIFFKEKISLPQTLGIIVAFLGLVLLVSKGDITSLDFIKNKGDLLIISSSITWSFYSMVNKKVTFNLSPVLTTFYLFLIVAVIIAPFTINQNNISDVFRLSISGWGSILFLGIFCSGIAYTLWAQALNEMSASKVGAFLYIEPFVTFFGAWLLLNEQITVLTLLSGLIIIGGVVLVNRK